MKAISASNNFHQVYGPGERCRARCQAKLPQKNPEGWHICRLKAGHPGPHQCVHGEFPLAADLWKPGPDGGKLVAMPAYVPPATVPE